jgi:hypothetical protein
MKKILTIMLIFVVVAGYGQSLRLIVDGVSYNNNDTVSLVIGDVSRDNDFYIDVANLTDSVVDLMIRKTELYVVAGTTNVFVLAINVIVAINQHIRLQFNPGTPFHMLNILPMHFILFILPIITWELLLSNILSLIKMIPQLHQT